MRRGFALPMGRLIGIGWEIHGRPSGFRTHMLVCLASALLMQITLDPGDWLIPSMAELVRIDPIRMAQGIVTGVGFLGAGEIFRQGWNMRGLTTAASIWVTAALGIAVGLGMYFVATASTIAALLVLMVLNWLERRLPVEHYMHHTVRFARADIMDELELRELLRDYHFAVNDLSHGLIEAGRMFEYRMILHTRERDAPGKLSCT